MDLELVRKRDCAIWERHIARFSKKIERKYYFVNLNLI